MICPLMSCKKRVFLWFTKNILVNCLEKDCAWFCNDTGVCAIFKIQEELIKLNGGLMNRYEFWPELSLI